jgi:DNA helicase II / ATP-dependent DNA helicase PcrA
VLASDWVRAFGESVDLGQHLVGLNEAQRAAAEHGVANGSRASAPLLVIAGAGSGKTNTLAHRVANLVVHGADPRRILLLTFSRRAATEMARRVERIVASAVALQNPAVLRPITWSGTFHAIGARLLRHYARDIGIDPAFTIHDREDSADLMNLVRHELGLSTKERRFPLKATCLAIYSLAVNAQLPIDVVLARQFPWCKDWKGELRALFKGYVDAKQRQNVLDYDDLLLYWAEMMCEPSIANAISERFEHVLVDEYQDTNRLQALVLTRMKPDGCGVTVVGDDAQSIYSFRAAEIRNILDFPGLFTPPAHVITLEKNYRSTQAILNASNAVISIAAERFTKDLTSDRPSAQKPALVSVRDGSDQVTYVVERILEAREAGVPLKAQAVLFRAAHHSAELEIELARRNIPFVKFGGLRFLEAAHVKDVLSVLRLAENPGDRVAGFRVLQLLPGIGPTTAGRLLERIAERLEPREVIRDFRPTAATREDWPAFVELFVRLRSSQASWPADLGDVRAWYEPHLERLHADAQIRRADLHQLEQIAAGFPTRERFLTELTLDPPNATSDQADAPLLDEDYLILSTIHSAKGQEWKSVYVLNVVDGCIPSDMATETPAQIEEERRLLYVAMTRAKDDLHLIVPQRFFTHQQPSTGDRHVFASRTRFIPAGILDRFACLAWPVSQRQDRSTRPVITAPVDLKSRMRGMWA